MRVRSRGSRSTRPSEPVSGVEPTLERLFAKLRLSQEGKSEVSQTGPYSAALFMPQWTCLIVGLLPKLCTFLQIIYSLFDMVYGSRHLRRSL